MPKIDAPEVTASAKPNDKVYVTIPEKDAEDRNHAPVIINGVRYEPGQKYFVEPLLAETIETRIKLWNKNVGRLHQRTPDLKAFNAPNPGNTYALFKD